MRYEAMIRNYFEATSAFWLDVTERWRRAQRLAEKEPPEYRFDTWLSDTIALSSKGVDAWFRLMEGGPRPVLPTAYVTAPAASLPGQKPTGSAFVVADVPEATPTVQVDILATDTGRINGAGSIPASALGVSLSDGTLVVKLDVVGPPPAAGLYQGLAYAQVSVVPAPGAPARPVKVLPLAVILIQLT
jgi:hypothetical protein